MPKRVRMALLFGGRSSEHDVSRTSAKAVLAAIDPEKYEVVPVYISREGHWARLAAQAVAELDTRETSPVGLLPDPSLKGLVTLGRNGTLAAHSEVSEPAIDVVFPLLHGPYGEDGTVQGLLDLANVPYVGSGVLGSAVGMDKAVMKALFEHQGLPLTPYRVVLRSRWRREPAAVRQEIEAAFPYPWFVKPANLGSSIGITKVHGPEELAAAMDEAARYDRKLVIEEAIAHAREIEVSILGNDEPIASIPGEIIPANEFYNYDAKYVDPSSRLCIPADIPAELAERLRALALDAYRCLDCAGLARVDFLVRGDDLKPFVSEINTMPGFTPVSMYPKLWEATGIPYRDLIDRLIALAFERYGDRQEANDP